MAERAVLVTGASRGIGRAVAEAFAGQGDRVAVHHRGSPGLARQVLAGLTTGRLPRFVKRYASLRDTLLDATRRFTDDVSGGRYPDAEHSYT